MLKALPGSRDLYKKELLEEARILLLLAGKRGAYKCSQVKKWQPKSNMLLIISCF